MKNFKIKFKNGKKELELEVGTIDSDDELLLVKNILASFDIHTGDTEVDTKREEIVNKKLKSYEEGYNVLNNEIEGVHEPISEFEKPVPPIQTNKKVVDKETSNPKNIKINVSPENDNKEVEINSNPPIPAMAEAFKKAVDDTKNDNIKNLDKDELKSKLKNSFDGHNIRKINNEERYQIFYVCPNKKCKHKGKRFIPKNTLRVNCHSCNRHMTVRAADERGFPNTDEFGNFFVAGDFVLNKESSKIL